MIVDLTPKYLSPPTKSLTSTPPPIPKENDSSEDKESSRVETVQKQYLPVFRGISVLRWKYKVNSQQTWNITKYRYWFILYRFYTKESYRQYQSDPESYRGYLQDQFYDFIGGVSEDSSEEEVDALSWA